MKEYKFSIEFKTVMSDTSEFLRYPDEVLQPLAEAGLRELVQTRLDEINEGATHTWVLFSDDPLPKELV
jgi:hypothetical protein